MLDPTALKDGTYYTWQGRTYVGSMRSPTTAVLLSTEPEEGFRPRRSGRGFEREVPRTEVATVTLRTVALWRGHRLPVLARTADGLVLSATGLDPAEATAAGATTVDRGVVNLTVPMAEVSAIEQERTTD